MIHCPSCGAANQEGNKFCNECGYTFSSGENTRCPMCSADNPVGTVFCHKCGARLVPISGPLPEEPTPMPIKGLSLPSKPVSEGEGVGEPTAGPQDEEGEEQALRWLRRLGRSQGDETIAEASAAWHPEPEVPDWLQALRRKYPEEVPLKDRPAPPPASVATDIGPEAEREEADWLQMLRVGTSEEKEEPAPVRAEEPEVPDWLRDLPPAAEEEEEETPPAEARETEVPDWLRDLPPAAEEEEEPAPVRAEESPPAEADRVESPDWLAALGSALAEEGPPAAPEAEVPDWIKGLEPTPGVTEAPPEPAGEEVPDWLKDLRPFVTAAPPVTPAAEDEKVPDWLRALAEAAPPVEEEPPAVQLAAEEGVREPSAERPAWLRETGPPEKEEAPIAVEAEESEAVPSELPDWLKDIGPAVEEATSPALAEEAPPAEPEEPEAPGWLQTPASVKTEEATAALLEEEELARAQIPDWLEALRPVEREDGAATSEAAVAEVTETSGALAGIRGVLPIEPLVGEPRSTKPLTLPPSTVGKEHAAVFEAVITGPAPAPIERGKKRQRGVLARLLRLATHAFLLSAVLVPILLGTQRFTAADVAGGSDSSRAFFTAVQSLPPDSTVLMAYDYDPATAAEMNLQAEAIVHHLMSQNLKLVTVSLLPAGPAVAQDIMERAATAHPGYLYGERYLNLGYRPGQEAAVRDLAQNPIDVLKVDYLNRESLTAIPLAQNIRRVEDLAFIVELADSQDSLRWWIEQVGSQHDVPIAAGVSAPVEPYARAFFSSGQLAGLVSGLVGAAEYEALTQRPASAIDSLEPQAAAHLALLVLIVVGNVVYLLTRSGKKS